MPRVPKEVHDEHLAETERVLIRMRAAFRVEAYLVKKFGIHSRTARKWIQDVKKRWGAEASTEDRTSKRNEMRVMLNEFVYEAMTKTVVVKDSDGKVVLDANPNSPNFGRPVVRQQPDIQRALHAAAQLRALDGLDAPIKLKVDGNAAGVLVVGAPPPTSEGWADKYRNAAPPELPPDVTDDPVDDKPTDDDQLDPEDTADAEEHKASEAP